MKQRSEPLICPKCNREAMSAVNVARPGKNPGTLYEYRRFVHYNPVDHRKKNAPRRSYCYIRQGGRRPV